MGYIVDRPLKEGVGEKPTTPKPVPRSAVLIRGHGGEKPATVKPVPKRPVSGPATEQR